MVILSMKIKISQRMKRLNRFKLKKLIRLKKIKKFKDIKQFINCPLLKRIHLQIKILIKIYRLLYNKIDQKVKAIYKKFINKTKFLQVLTKKNFNKSMERISKFHNFPIFYKINFS
jgi:hypothetical protein